MLPDEELELLEDELDDEELELDELLELEELELEELELEDELDEELLEELLELEEPVIGPEPPQSLANTQSALLPGAADVHHCAL